MKKTISFPLFPFLFSLGVAAAAEVYPARALRLIVPFPPGGPSDIVARVFIQRVGESLGQPLVMDNRGGAGGALGTEIGARAASDGYTLVQTTAGTMAPWSVSSRGSTSSASGSRSKHRVRLVAARSPVSAPPIPKPLPRSSEF